MKKENFKRGSSTKHRPKAHPYKSSTQTAPLSRDTELDRLPLEERNSYIFHKKVQDQREVIIGPRNLPKKYKSDFSLTQKQKERAGEGLALSPNSLPFSLHHIVSNESSVNNSSLSGNFQLEKYTSTQSSQALFGRSDQL